MTNNIRGQALREPRLHPTVSGPNHRPGRVAGRLGWIDPRSGSVCWLAYGSISFSLLSLTFFSFSPPYHQAEPKSYGESRGGLRLVPNSQAGCGFSTVSGLGTVLARFFFRLDGSSLGYCTP